MAFSKFNLQSMKFLVVDDNQNMSRLVSGVLVALGVEHFNIKVCSDGADALKELRFFDADIAICDWNREPLDGIEFTKLVRTSSDCGKFFLPIIMLTGHTEMNRVAEARDAGINEFLAKPISAKSLYARISSIIETPRQFIRTMGVNGYFGPDRRRRDDTTYRDQERRAINKETDVQEPDSPSEQAETSLII